MVLCQRRLGELSSVCYSPGCAHPGIPCPARALQPAISKTLIIRLCQEGRNDRPQGLSILLKTEILIESRFLAVCLPKLQILALVVASDMSGN